MLALNRTPSPVPRFSDSTIPVSAGRSPSSWPSASQIDAITPNLPSCRPNPHIKFYTDVLLGLPGRPPIDGRRLSRLYPPHTPNTKGQHVSLYTYSA